MESEKLRAFFETITDRRCEVLGAAFEVFQEKGFAGATMLAIAKRAKASKETLYSWFGSKAVLFEALILMRMKRLAESQVGPEGSPDLSPIEGLRLFSRHFLTMIVMPSTVTVQRIAIGEVNSNPQLGRILVESGQNATHRITIEWLERLRLSNVLAYRDAEEVCETYLSILMGSWNFAMLLGQMPPPPPEAIDARVDHALAVLLKVWGA